MGSDDSNISLQIAALSANADTCTKENIAKYQETRIVHQANKISLE